MKYRPYPCPKEEEIVYSDGAVTVYLSGVLGRYILTKHGFELGFKNTSDTYGKPVNINYAKWYTAWEKNATSQLHKIGARIDALKDEQDEILNLL